MIIYLDLSFEVPCYVTLHPTLLVHPSIHPSIGLSAYIKKCTVESALIDTPLTEFRLKWIEIHSHFSFPFFSLIVSNRIPPIRDEIC